MKNREPRKSADVPVTWDEYMAVIVVVIIFIGVIWGAIVGVDKLASRIRTRASTESENAESIETESAAPAS
jgi:hypothetical protein